jgi:uncharacterized glyoxalase superfamily protein PhnB
MATLISAMLSVTDGKAALDFYQKAFGATVNWTIGGGAVAGMNIDGADFFFAHESPQYGNRSPSSAGFTTVRVELFTDDPEGVFKRAVDAGAKVKDPLTEYNYPMEGPKPIKHMLQGAVFDPFGHIWLIGKILG